MLVHGIEIANTRYPGNRHRRAGIRTHPEGNTRRMAETTWSDQPITHCRVKCTVRSSTAHWDSRKRKPKTRKSQQRRCFPVPNGELYDIVRGRRPLSEAADAYRNHWTYMHQITRLS